MAAIAIDANLLVLLVVGTTDARLIEKHKRTKIFDPEDFVLLQDILRRYDQILVTPHIVTETSNLLGQTQGAIAAKLREKLQRFLGLTTERYDASEEVAAHPLFVRLGITDSAILKAIGGTVVLLTTDLDLYHEALRQAGKAVNFNHLRMAKMAGA